MPKFQSPKLTYRCSRCFGIDNLWFWQVDSVFQQTATPTGDVLPTWLSAVDTLELTGEVVSSPLGL